MEADSLSAITVDLTALFNEDALPFNALLEVVALIVALALRLTAGAIDADFAFGTIALSVAATFDGSVLRLIVDASASEAAQRRQASLAVRAEAKLAAIGRIRRHEKGVEVHSQCRVEADLGVVPVRAGEVEYQATNAVGVVGLEFSNGGDDGRFSVIAQFGIRSIDYLHVA